VNYNKFQFLPHRNVGIQLPPGTTETTPKGLFQLYFTDKVVDDICRCSNEYAEVMKPGMYSTYKGINPEDFLSSWNVNTFWVSKTSYKLAWRR